MRVLVAEDDRSLRSVLQRGLRENGYVVDAVADGEGAVKWLRAYDYEVAVVDWRMPGKSGIEVIEELRRLGVKTPVLMLTARDAPADRVAGLRTGADDYLVKPFDFDELLARLDALQRRPALRVSPRLELGDLRFDPATRQVTVGGEPVSLTVTELGILELLLRRAPSVVSRRSIAVQVWDDEADAIGSNTIDVHIGRLRSKLSASNVAIQTVRGTGYRVTGPAEPAPPGPAPREPAPREPAR
jgi:two-component system, OmpR family, response regulator